MNVNQTRLPEGKIPVELLQRQWSPRITISGVGVLVFPPRDEFTDAQGEPRRLEFVSQQEHVNMLLSNMYNKPGLPPLFGIAHDLVQSAQAEMFRSQVMQVVQEEVNLKNVNGFRQQVELLGESLGQLQRRVEEVFSSLSALQEQVEDLGKKKSPGRPRKKLESEEETGI